MKLQYLDWKKFRENLGKSNEIYSNSLVILIFYKIVFRNKNLNVMKAIIAALNGGLIWTAGRLSEIEYEIIYTSLRKNVCADNSD